MDLEKTVQFMVEQQAEFWADIRALEARQAETARLADENRERIGQLVGVCTSLAQHVGTLAQHAEDTDRRIHDFAEETNRRFQETDYKLNALIETVDKLTRRNGGHTAS
ncbi:MAG: hypothetical protein ACRD1N_11105 [Terriglobia bacterium]